MSSTIVHPRDPRERVSIPTIWIAVAVSVLIHVLALWISAPNLRRMLVEKPGKQESSGPIELRLAAPTPPRSAPQPPAPPRAASPDVTPRRAEPKRTQPRPAEPRPAPVPRATKIPDGVPVVPPPPVAPAPPAPAPPSAPPQAGDFASMIEARRRARGAAEPAVPAPAEAEDDQARRKRVVAANLGLDRTPTFGRDPGGGIFQITRMGYSDAEFIFYGWSRDIQRNTSQLIVVRKGEHSDIRLAVVRRMIAIIREHEKNEFVWESRRLGRDVTLSARLADNAGLEEFMLREFFGESRIP